MVAQYENGHRTPKFETIRKIAEALQVDCSDIDESIIDVRSKPVIDIKKLISGSPDSNIWVGVGGLNSTNDPSDESVFVGSAADVEIFATAIRFKYFGGLLEANDIKYQVCELDGRAGKLFSFNEKEGFKYFLTNEQAKQLPEMSIEQIKALIRSFDKMNKEEITPDSD